MQSPSYSKTQSQPEIQYTRLRKDIDVINIRDESGTLIFRHLAAECWLSDRDQYINALDAFSALYGVNLAIS